MSTLLPVRRSPRLQGYDYAQEGAYFVTICTHERALLFGAVRDGAMVLSQAGSIAAERWLALSQHHPGVEVDAFVVMPNHVHAIILVGTTPASSVPAPALDHQADRAGPVPTARLGVVVGSYKSGVTRRIREALDDPGLLVWQGRYHDHIIRSEADLLRIQQYVAQNPARWSEDRFFK